MAGRLPVTEKEFQNTAILKQIKLRHIKLPQNAEEEKKEFESTSTKLKEADIMTSLYQELVDAKNQATWCNE